MPCLSKTARPQISAVSLPASLYVPDRRFCKDVRFYRIPICQFYYLGCAVLKVKPNFAPFAVVVRLILVDSGGYFFVLLSHIGLFQRHGMMTGRLGIVPSFSMLARYLVSIFTFSAKSFRARFFAFRASFTSAPKVSKPGQSLTFAIQHHPHTFYVA